MKSFDLPNRLGSFSFKHRRSSSGVENDGDHTHAYDHESHAKALNSPELGNPYSGNMRSPSKDDEHANEHDLSPDGDDMFELNGDKCNKQPSDLKASKEWDASKVPPSQFQRRKGSIYATPASRTGGVGSSVKERGQQEKLKQKGRLFGRKFSTSVN